MAIDKKLICFARLEEFERQLAAGNILDKSIVFIQDANKIYNRGTYYDCQSPYVLPFDIETLDGLSYSDNEGRLQTDADVFEKAKSAIEMGRMVVIRYGLSDAGYHICDATYNGDAISVRVYNGLMLYSFEIYASSQGSIVVEQYSLQSELVDGVNIATINGQSLTAGGDLTIESGAKIYEWFYDGESESATLSQEEYDNIVEADLVVVKLGGIMSFTVSKTGKEFSEALGNYVLTGQVDMQGSKMYFNVSISISTKLATITFEEQNIPTKTSQLENDSNFITSEDVAAVALSGSYNDLQDTPTIPSAVTESTVSGWGFTKNTGTYSKPSGGIPKTDLASAVQTSLGKADTALQSDAISEFLTADDLAAVATSGSYNDLTDNPFIPNADSIKTWGFVKGVKLNGSTKTPSVSDGIVDLGTIEGGSTDEFVTKETIGVLTVANVQALYDGNDIYALPSSANGDEDDVIVSKRTLKTINGQSLIGEGDITIGEGGGSSSGGGMNIVVMDDYVVDYAEPNTIYVITTNGIGGGLEVYEFIPPTNGYAEYVFIFQVGVMDSGFSIPEYVMWPNGQLPDVVPSGDSSYAEVYELNISASLVDGGEYIYKAVLTHFKEVQW